MFVCVCVCARVFVCACGPSEAEAPGRHPRRRQAEEGVVKRFFERAGQDREKRRTVENLQLNCVCVCGRRRRAW